MNLWDTLTFQPSRTIPVTTLRSGHQKTELAGVDAGIINESDHRDGKILVISRRGASNRKNGIAFYDNPSGAPKPSPNKLRQSRAACTALRDGHYVY